jgi:hypothetical protein
MRVEGRRRADWTKSNPKLHRTPTFAGGPLSPTFAKCRRKWMPHSEGEPMQPVVRISILRCARENFDNLQRMMTDADAVLRPGIEAMPGLISFYAGADEATLSLMNVSIWTTLENAKQLDTYQPMLDLGKTFVQAGATFERPIMNHLTLWQLHGAASR